MSATRLLIWDFDGTLAHRRDETGWSILLAEALDAEEPGHPHSADTFRPHLREGFPWHQPEVAHPELCELEAWWARSLSDGRTFRIVKRRWTPRALAGLVRQLGFELDLRDTANAHFLYGGGVS